MLSISQASRRRGTNKFIKLKGEAFANGANGSTGVSAAASEAQVKAKAVDAARVATEKVNGFLRSP